MSFRLLGQYSGVRQDIRWYQGIDAPEGKKQGLTYRIPVDKIEEYKVGEKLLVIVEANIEEEIWDLDHLRFEIEPIENQ